MSEFAAKHVAGREWHRRRRGSARGHARGRDRSSSAQIPGKVVLKIQSPDIPHKTDAGGVALDLAAAEEVGNAFDAIIAAAHRYNAAARVDGVLVEAMAPPGREMIVGITRDAVFGPMLLVGFGGVYTEVFDDVAIGPLTDSIEVARGRIAGLRGARLLDGVRGEAPGDVDALAELMVELSKFVVTGGRPDQRDRSQPGDLVHARGEGVTIVDALISRISAQFELRKQ